MRRGGGSTGGCKARGSGGLATEDVRVWYAVYGEVSDSVSVSYG